jgi:hypothetical protein
MVDRYFGDGELVLRVSDLLEREVGETVAKRVVELLDLEPWLTAGGSTDPTGRWDRIISREIRHFRDVDDIDDYLARTTGLWPPQPAPTLPQLTSLEEVALAIQSAVVAERAVWEAATSRRHNRQSEFATVVARRVRATLIAAGALAIAIALLASLTLGAVWPIVATGGAVVLAFLGAAALIKSFDLTTVVRALESQVKERTVRWLRRFEG